MYTKIIEVDGLEMVQRPPASCVLAFSPTGNVLLCEQNRGTFGKILEVPAGKVEVGEEPHEAALRELEEETGYVGDNTEHLISYYPSVGYTTEEIHCYFVKTIGRHEQRLDEGEKIEVVQLPLYKIEEMIENGHIKDSKTIMCVKAFREKEKMLDV